MGRLPAGAGDGRYRRLGRVAKPRYSSIFTAKDTAPRAPGRRAPPKRQCSAACFTDRRDQAPIEHRVRTLVGQRVFAATACPVPERIRSRGGPGNPRKANGPAQRALGWALS